MLENLVNPNVCVMPWWCWMFLLYGIFTAVSRFTNFLCRGNKKRKNKRVSTLLFFCKFDGKFYLFLCLKILCKLF